MARYPSLAPLWPKVKSSDFIGKAAYLAARDEEPAALLCTLTMDSQVSATGIERYPMGGNEPVLTLDGDRIVDRKGRVSRVTTAGAAPSLGEYLLMAPYFSGTGCRSCT